MRTAVSAIAISMVMLGACGGGGGDDTTGDDTMGDDVPPGTLDVRVPIPAPDPTFLDLVTGEETIQPGEEKMFCYYMSNTDGDLAVRGLIGMQGQFGHHITLLTTIEPQPDGTREDCSAQEDMWKFRAYVLPIDDLPAGTGIHIPDGTQFVLQMHYVNTGEQPILVRDVARLRKIDPAAVTTWVATMTTNDLTVDLPPGESSKTWDCVLGEDLELLLVGGHMHEMGTKFTVEIGPDVDSLENLYLVDPWRAEYRDSPPITLYLTSPRHLVAGTVIRTTCTWMNPEATNIEFPAEMCSAFGYLAGSQTPFHCQTGME
jgi:hypothetical protein